MKWLEMQFKHNTTVENDPVEYFLDGSTFGANTSISLKDFS